ncbi:heterokaryon incompatibility protein-domain-containing protein [Lasiosphaeria ovina]|uniref:Heterokaryon incompatibility protein-domain-containing protein n=1 Tax=Lasiosphaeria ovina TaxID=92902 RepID=A0AAE0NFN3_9PEZI|nr:heterokaryon incompatibility protein-domain-containing protein [Lasiosphaeria ovina]
MTLCDRCEQLDLGHVFEQSVPPNRSTIPGGWMHSDSFAMLRLSADTCAMCSILMGDAGSNPLVEDDDSVRLLTFTRDWWRLLEGPRSLPGPIAGLEVIAGPKGVNEAHSVRHLPIWTADTPSMDLTLDEDPADLPTRVLDVGLASSGPDSVCLVLPGSQKGRYIALSHCWGTLPVTTTVTSTLHQRMQGIFVHELSTNFQHAIQMTRQLGYRYLWIDSVCIIQDDANDWAVESAKMAQVYTRASLTLAAANSAAAGDGFLNPRPTRRAVTISHRSTAGVIVGHVTIGEQTSQEIYRDGFRYDVNGGPLALRGWTLQERLLARRIVFFGSEESHWKCRTASWSESTRLWPVRSVDARAGRGSLDKLPIFGPPFFRPVDPNVLLNDWYTILQEFTSRSLTKKDTDKLPALSGIAKVIEAGFGASDAGLTTPLYHAGLWAHDLPRALLWQSFGPEPSTGMSGGVLPGPSWSWISRDARILPAREARAADNAAQPDILAVEWDVTLDAGGDPHGRVALSKHTLTLQGYIKAVPTIRAINRPSTPSTTSAPYPLSNALLYDSHAQQIGAAVLDDPAGRSAFDQTLYAVPVRHFSTGGAGGQRGRGIGSIEALLLVLAQEGGTCYRRVGVADMMGSNANDERCKGAPFAHPFQVFFYDATRGEIKIA